jgi:periplasmic divalent cation tolerance protein
MTDDDVCEIVITAPDAGWLADFTRRLVQDRLCACAHHISTIRSIYRWKGQVYDEEEARAALHTRTALVAEIARRADREHPYELPALSALPIVEGSPRYLKWIRDETSEVGEPQEEPGS